MAALAAIHANLPGHVGNKDAHAMRLARVHSELSNKLEAELEGVLEDELENEEEYEEAEYNFFSVTFGPGTFWF